VSQLLLSGTHEADVVADISNGIEQKVKAVLAHESQLREEPDWVRSAVSVRAEQAGREIGVTYGEAFRLVDFTK
jgi:LmbE family N-acetylglucosaminyl deacetylase